MQAADGSVASLHVLRLTPYYYLPFRPVTTRELQYEPVGGMQVQIAQTTEHLDRLGVRQTIVAPRRPGMPRALAIGRRSRLRLLRLPVAPVRTRSKGYLGLLVSWGLSLVPWLMRARARGRTPFSLVHVHCSELPWTYLVAVMAAALLRRPLVITTHCSALVTFEPDTAMGRLLLGPARRAERAAVRRAHAVIVLTERARSAYEQLDLVAPSRIHVVPDGVDLDVFRSAPPRAADGYAAVLYCGRFAPEKGWEDFVEAVAILRRCGSQARFTMCGDGNELDRCRRLLARRGLTADVELTGHLGREEVADRIRRTDVVVVPSRHEELGGTVLEALATGRAIVATAVGGLPEVVSAQQTGALVPAGRPDELAGAVELLLRDDELRARLGRAGPAEVARFDASKVARDLVDVYSSVAAEAA